MLLIGSMETNLHSGGWFSTERVGLQLYALKMTVACFFRGRSQLIKSHSDFCSRRPAKRLCNKQTHARFAAHRAAATTFPRAPLSLFRYFGLPGPHNARPG